jgi:hypothetical protein
MTTSHFLASRLREVLLNGTWIANTNFKDQITSISWYQAIQKIENLNTIALLTYHVNYYLAGLITVFKGGPLEIRDKYSFDMPPITSAHDWNQLVETFINNSTVFIEHVSKLDDETLNQPFVEEKYGTYIRNIEGVIEHSYYHLGQISLIKKMILY